MEFMQAGGPLMWVIAALSVAGAAVFFERAAFFASRGEAPEPLELKIGKMLADGDVKGAVECVSGGPSSLRRVFRSGLAHWDADADALKELLSQETRREVFRWSRYVGALSIIARIAPLLGLLGTVLGMVEMFRALPGGGSSMTEVAGGIWKALFTTAAGLVVSIPALLMHAWLSSRVDMEEEKLTRAAEFLLREKMLRGVCK